MTTSLAALAATSSAQTSAGVSVPNSSINCPSPVLDITDSNYEIKTEFYTREGLWKLVPSLEFAKQIQNTGLNNSSPSTNLNYNASQTGQNTQSPLNHNNNDPVKINLFTFKKNIIFKDFHLNSQSNRRNLCRKCSSTKKPNRLNKLAESDSDEDNSDVIFSNIGENSSESESGSDLEKACRQCKTNLSRYDSESSADSYKKFPNQILDLMIFNYGREIYNYESGSVNYKGEFKNFIDKKTYKCMMSTCFDVNEAATVCNTLSLQLNKTININLSSSDFDKINFSTAPSQLSLIVAAGFNKGEIHMHLYFTITRILFEKKHHSKRLGILIKFNLIIRNFLKNIRFKNFQILFLIINHVHVYDEVRYTILRQKKICFHSSKLTIKHKLLKQVLKK
ncbi:hypothetical protein BpHYR1_042756 [Brachionus plicatilis]|uniref:Uncharacterized protein n=1 Tax=Brachionus plicatilis TaxID=10195 RepID=A0A3M7R7S4_BRAPC|nr:hypothetical protein BpHYR1_042756 [Brachionus plicatilis]